MSKVVLAVVVSSALGLAAAAWGLVPSGAMGDGDLPVPSGFALGAGVVLVGERVDAHGRVFSGCAGCSHASSASAAIL